MKPRLRIFYEIEILIPLIAKSTVSCEKSQDENNNKNNNNKLNYWLEKSLIAKSSVSSVWDTVDLATDGIDISILAKYLNLSFSECTNRYLSNIFGYGKTILKAVNVSWAVASAMCPNHNYLSSFCGPFIVQENKPWTPRLQ